MIRFYGCIRWQSWLIGGCDVYSGYVYMGVDDVTVTRASYQCKKKYKSQGYCANTLFYVYSYPYSGMCILSVAKYILGCNLTYILYGYITVYLLGYNVPMVIHSHSVMVIRSFVHSFVHSFIHSFTIPILNLSVYMPIIQLLKLVGLHHSFLRCL